MRGAKWAKKRQALPLPPLIAFFPLSPHALTRLPTPCGFDCSVFCIYSPNTPIILLEDGCERYWNFSLESKTTHWIQPSSIKDSGYEPLHHRLCLFLRSFYCNALLFFCSNRQPPSVTEIYRNTSHRDVYAGSPTMDTHIAALMLCFHLGSRQMSVICWQHDKEQQTTFSILITIMDSL